MPTAAKKQYCVGSAGFDPSAAASDDTLQAQIDELLKKDDLLGASRVLFKLPNNDDYVYHANASVSLAQVQHIVQLGGVNGLHNWYKMTDGTPVSGSRLTLHKRASIANNNVVTARSTVAIRYRCIYSYTQSQDGDAFCTEKLQDERQERVYPSRVCRIHRRQKICTSSFGTETNDTQSEIVANIQSVLSVLGVVLSLTRVVRPVCIF